MNILKTEILGTTWYAATRSFASDDAAARSFVRLHDAGVRLQGELNIGCYRHHDGRGDRFFVTCVGVDPESIEFASFMLGGKDIELPGEVYTALVARRIRKLAEFEQEGRASGVHRFPHGDGVRLDWKGEEL